MRSPREAVRELVRDDGLLRRVAAGTGVEEVLHLQRRVEDLEEAVAENAALETPLARRVAELEQALVGVLELREAALRSRRGRGAEDRTGEDED